MKGAKVQLSQGLAASASKGTPISGKFEVEDGKLQLSVYTAEGTNLLGSDRRSQDRQGEGVESDYRRRRSYRGQGAGRGDGVREDVAEGGRGRGGQGQQGLPRGERDSVNEERACQRGSHASQRQGD